MGIVLYLCILRHLDIFSVPLLFCPIQVEPGHWLKLAVGSVLLPLSFQKVGSTRAENPKGVPQRTWGQNPKDPNTVTMATCGNSPFLLMSESVRLLPDPQTQS